MNSFLPYLLQQQQPRRLPTSFLPSMPQLGAQGTGALHGPTDPTPDNRATPQSFGDMLRDTIGVGRGMIDPNWGTVVGSLSGVPGMGAIVGTGVHQFDVSQAARAGDPRYTGSGVPSQQLGGALAQAAAAGRLGITPSLGASPWGGIFGTSAPEKDFGFGFGQGFGPGASMDSGGGIGTSGGQSAGPGGKGDSTGGGAKGEGGGGWYARGGVVHGQGFLPGNPPGPDNQIAAVQTGEGILTRAAMKHYPGLLASANAGKLPKKATKVR